MTALTTNYKTNRVLCSHVSFIMDVGKTHYYELKGVKTFNDQTTTASFSAGLQPA